MKFTGTGATGWQPLDAAGFAAGWEAYPELAIAGNDTPYVPVTGADAKITVMRFVSGAWQVAGTSPMTEGRSYYHRMTIGGDNIPHVVYMDADANLAALKRFAGGAWETVDLAGARYFELPGLGLLNVDIAIPIVRPREPRRSPSRCLVKRAT